MDIDLADLLMFSGAKRPRDCNMAPKDLAPVAPVRGDASPRVAAICGQFRNFVCIILNSLGNFRSQAALEETSAVFNLIQTASGRERRLLAIRAAIARRPDCGSTPAFVEPASQSCAFEIASEKSPGRGVSCLPSNRPARLRRQ